MKLYLDIGISQLNKKGEELCGDSIEILQSTDSSVIVLADGLASGVKANILSRITAKTAATMLKMGSHIDEVIETMANTLPVDKVRNLAYSTFSILQVFQDGRSYLAEFDNPKSYFGCGGLLQNLHRVTRIIGEKKIDEAHFQLKEGHWLVMLSDGVLHAGIGGVWNFGWGEIQVGRFIKKLAASDYEAADWASEITAQCNLLYGGLPGDDVSIVVVKARKARKLTALIGPPQEAEKDTSAVEKLAGAAGVKVVCGGSTSMMASRILDKEITVDLDSDSSTVPPTGIIEGIDLVTEGAITLYYALQHLRKERGLKDLEPAR
ncbi:MAG: SpoIIE family protein phosphatase, partial [Desulfotomaculaceae bacterium]|nr:SpoIIE family protein phosphatase [Desulfotomaculaceae bacterium]